MCNILLITYKISLAWKYWNLTKLRTIYVFWHFVFLDDILAFLSNQIGINYRYSGVKYLSIYHKNWRLNYFCKNDPSWTCKDYILLVALLVHLKPRVRQGPLSIFDNYITILKDVKLKIAENMQWVCLKLIKLVLLENIQILPSYGPFTFLWPLRF